MVLHSSFGRHPVVVVAVLVLHSTCNSIFPSAGKRLKKERLINDLINRGRETPRNHLVI